MSFNNKAQDLKKRFFIFDDETQTRRCHLQALIEAKKISPWIPEDLKKMDAPAETCADERLFVIIGGHEKSHLHIVWYSWRFNARHNASYAEFAATAPNATPKQSRQPGLCGDPLPMVKYHHRQFRPSMCHSESIWAVDKRIEKNEDERHATESEENLREERNLN